MGGNDPWHHLNVTIVHLFLPHLREFFVVGNYYYFVLQSSYSLKDRCDRLMLYHDVATIDDPNGPMPNPFRIL